MGELLDISGKLNSFERPEQPWSSRGGLSGDAELLEAMVDGASEGLVLLSAGGLILRANRAAFQFIGHEREAAREPRAGPGGRREVHLGRDAPRREDAARRRPRRREERGDAGRA